MSELKVNSIKGTGASTAAITIDSSSGGCSANITNNLTNRRLTINGAMTVAQRGTSSTSSGYQTLDRFKLLYDNITNSPTQAQVDVASGTTPYTLGFRKALKITNGDQTIGADDRLRLQHVLEAQDIANSGWNYTSTSSYITLSFWIKSSVAQNFFIRLQTQDGTTQNYVVETGSLTADTWTKITKSIPGNSNLQFDNDNDAGLLIDFGPFYGTNFTGTRPLNAWAAYDGATRFPNFTTTWFDTNDATLEITGVQLEVGSVATDFEHRVFNEELRLCERYFHMSYNTGRAIGSTGSGGNLQHNGTNNHAGTCQMNLNFPVEMRANPTLVAYSGDTGNSGNWTGTSNSAGLGDRSTTFYLTNTKRTSIYINTGGSRVACGLTGQYTADAEL
jgi:hypothetical protein